MTSWPGVEHRHLASLEAVAQTRSFRGAAQSLGYSQSALSQQIAQLERLLGVVLAHRRRGSSDVTLTAAGDALLRRVQPILAVHRAAQADLEALVHGDRRLRVGVAEHLGLGVPSALLASLVQRRPGIAAELVRAADGAQLLTELTHGRLDVVLGDPPAEDDGGATVTELLTSEPYMLLVPEAWSIARRPDVSFAELLNNLPLSLDDADPHTARVVADLRANGIELAEPLRVASLDEVVAHVAAGASAALVPQGLACEATGPVAILSLDGLVGHRAVGVMRQAGRRHAPLVDAFVATARRDHPTCGAGCAQPSRAARSAAKAARA